MKVEQWPIDKPIAYARNARKITQAAVDKVASSIAEFGWRQPIVVDDQGVIVVGHTRLKAAQKLGLSEVPVHVATDLTDAQIKAYRIMDNRAHDETSWDIELLAPEIAELQSLSVDLALTGLEPAQLEKILFGESVTGDPATPPEQKPDIPPDEFKKFGEEIDTDYKCPMCEYEWSGKPKA